MPTIKPTAKKTDCQTAKIAHNKPCLDKDDAKAAQDAVLSGWVAYGEIGCRLEDRLSNYILGNEGHAVLCSSGTAGIYLALYALQIKSGDEVILPSYACTALLNALAMTGAKPVVVDIDPGNLSLTAANLKKHITVRTRAIIVVHSYGIPCELDELIALGLPIIEDCAQALGSQFMDGQPVGSRGDLSVFSFYATKFMTGGYGGAVVSRTHINSLRDYLDFDNPEEYKPRFNFMLSDINAAVALSQFDKLDRFLSRRKEIAQRYTEAIGDINIINRLSDRSERFNHFRYLVNLPNERALIDLKNHLGQSGIDTIIPLENRELLHNYLKLDRSLFPVAEQVSKTLLSLPIYPCLTDDEVNRVVLSLKDWNLA